MWRVAVIIGSRQEAGTSALASPTLPLSDRAAIGLALQRFGGLVHAYCRRGDPEAWRYALAAGAAHVRQLEAVAGLDFDVMLVGSGGAEPYGDLLLAQLAAEKQGAMAFEVLDVVCAPHGLTVTRDLGRGSREVLALDRPAVLGIAAEATQLLYVSRYRRQAVEAAVHVSHTEPLSGPLATLDSPWEPVRPRVRLGDLEARSTGSASTRLQTLFGIDTASNQGNDRSHIIAANAATCAQHLLRFLSHHGLMPASVAPSSPAATPVEAVDSPQQPTTPILREPHRRGPRPLAGAAGSVERRRGPRPLDAPPEDKAEQ